MYKNYQNSDWKIPAGVHEMDRRWMRVPGMASGTHRRMSLGMGSTLHRLGQLGGCHSRCLNSTNLNAQIESGTTPGSSASSEAFVAKSPDDSNSQLINKPATNYGCGTKIHKIMNDRELATLIDQIKSACANTNIRGMFYAQGSFHGAEYARKAPYYELKFLEAFDEFLGSDSGVGVLASIIQTHDFLAAINSERHFRFLSDGTMSADERLELARMYVAGFRIGAAGIMHGYDPEDRS